jgi:hypothetical protein
LNPIAIILDFPFGQVSGWPQMDKVSAFHFLLNMSLQRTNADWLKHIVLGKFIIYRQKRLHRNQSRFVKVLSIKHLFIWILSTLSLADCIGQFYIDLSDFRRWTGTAVCILLKEFHLVIGRQIFSIVIVKGYLSKGSCGPVVIGINWDGSVDVWHLHGHFLEIVVSVAETPLQVVNEIVLDIMRMMTVEMMLFYCGRVFVL